MRPSFSTKIILGPLIMMSAIFSVLQEQLQRPNLEGLVEDLVDEASARCGSERVLGVAEVLDDAADLAAERGRVHLADPVHVEPVDELHVDVQLEGLVGLVGRVRLPGRRPASRRRGRRGRAAGRGGAAAASRGAGPRPRRRAGRGPSGGRAGPIAGRWPKAERPSPLSTAELQESSRQVAGPGPGRRPAWSPGESVGRPGRGGWISRGGRGLLEGRARRDQKKAAKNFCGLGHGGVGEGAEGVGDLQDGLVGAASRRLDVERHPLDRQEPT